MDPDEIEALALEIAEEERIPLAIARDAAALSLAAAHAYAVAWNKAVFAERRRRFPALLIFALNWDRAAWQAGNEDATGDIS